MTRIGRPRGSGLRTYPVTRPDATAPAGPPAHLNVKNGSATANAVVDSKWLPYLAQFRWQLEPSGYVKRGLSTRGSDDRYHTATIRLHVEVAGQEPGKVVDHLNGNKLDNREANLRLTTQRINQRNRGRVSSNSTGFKGVQFSRQHQVFRATIHVDGKRHTRHAPTAGAAAQLYDDLARLHYGSDARLNFPKPNERGLDGRIVPDPEGESR
ncbi:HNH endonuclease [Deinococcus rufus]|uniref:HNH endonuclease n=1 Tax=Deinococcus rufus TaxID=2136097 RepID=A0ABV7Z9N2_9DEIO